MGNVQEQIEKALELERAKRDDAALQIFLRVSTEPGPHTEDPGFWLRLGETARRIGEREPAANAYHRAIGLLSSNGTPNNALAVARRLVALAPAAAANIRYGQIAVELGYGGIARDAFFRAAEGPPVNGDMEAVVEGLRATWAILRERGLEADAENVRARILKLRPDADPAAGASPPAPAPPPAVPASPEPQAPTGLSDDFLEPLDLDAGAPDDLPTLEPDRSGYAADAGGASAPADVSGDFPPLELDTPGAGAGEFPPLELDRPPGTGADELPSLDIDDPGAGGGELPSFDLEGAGDPGELPGLQDVADSLPELGASGGADLPPLEGLEPPLSLDDEAPPAAPDPDLLVEHPDERSLGLTGDLGSGGPPESEIDLDFDSQPTVGESEAPEAGQPSDPAESERGAGEDGGAALADDLEDLVAELEGPAGAEVAEEDADLDPIPPAAELSLDAPASEAAPPEAPERDLSGPAREPGPEAERGAAPGPRAERTNPFAPPREPPPAEEPPAPERRDPEPAPAAGAEGEFIDLAALILGEDEDAGTRFQTSAAGQPSGDEDRDFAQILDIFRREVSRKIHPKDSSSHYDLGVAYKEMGLLDDAIGQLQLALRAGANPVATLEVIGECFLEKNEPALAQRVLERATQVNGALEADLVGVLYWMGRCEEVLAQPSEARAHYERVIAVDISFRDAAARLRDLRTAN